MAYFPTHNLPVLGSCTDNILTQKICAGFSKFYSFLFENNIDSVGTFDLLLLYSFVVIFLAFLVASAITVFEEDQKSLQQIKCKVKLSSHAIANLAATLWAIKETKFKSITYEGYKRICKNKGALLRLQEPKVEITPRLIRSKSSSPKRENSPSILKRPFEPKVGISRLIPTQKKLNSIYNSNGKKSKFMRQSSSSSSIRVKPIGLSTRKSQHSIMSADKKINSKFVKKSVHIEDPTKI